ncbi:alpha/beta hydrolase domain-containing protein [Sphingomonas sp. RP10(2022)]|uniref:Alpha/beta hydrolase domain-containing protein n=1 Tax=Sphingomonas liriopis TaxID=2949094 RepID=A0A9X2HVL0_9SPHN|nr:alpha/beta hydrolase domain-containing protein [Sphingomonas liriopis]MCP3733520.1 alpha/beta hydrolase domain-containing protein [Sphingomonas liriopis]
MAVRGLIRASAALVCATLVAPPLLAGDKPAAVGRVTIAGPVTAGTKGIPYSASVVDLAPYGYDEKEYFVSGQAHPFRPVSGTTLGPDGRWRVEAGNDVAYTTRILVRRPSAAKFNGTVVVEVMQEYYGSERDTNFRWNAETLLRRGYAWVGVSLHHEGIDDPSPPKTIRFGNRDIPMGVTMARWDPARYGTLSVPTSDLSFDILSQVGRAIRQHADAPAATDPFAGLKVRKVIAAGNTIAAERLAIYINAVQPITHVFDGFYLQDFTPGARLKLAAGVETPAGVLRTDPDVPVVVLDTMTAATKMGSHAEGPKLRYWHPAGSSHTTGAFMARVDVGNKRDFGMGGGFCSVEKANSLPQQYISGAALVAVDRWAKGGRAAPRFPQLTVFTGPTAPVPEPRGYFDADGNVLGGMRNPWVDVPVARYDWRGDCLGGSGLTFRFSPEQLKARYGTPAAYHAKFAAAARDAARRGVILTEDVAPAIAGAKAVTW